MTIKKHTVAEIPGMGGFGSHVDLMDMKHYEYRQLDISVLHCATLLFEDRL
jgi:hypothetical protein